MAAKRTAQEAFGKTNGQLSAFAAAKLGRTRSSTSEHVTDRSGATVVIEQTDTLPNDTQAIAQPEDNSIDLDRSSRSNTALPPFRYSSTADESREDNATVYTLKSHDSIIAVGEYDVEVLEGAVTLYGAVLRKGSGSHRIYALSTHALPRIETRTPISRVRLSSINPQIGKLAALSLLFRGLGAQQSNGHSYAVLFSAKSDELQRTLSPLDDNPNSRKLLGQLCQKVETDASRLSIMCIGPKSSGKSTLTRTICNTLLTRTPVRSCLYLDIDPGQPEFGPPGQVSLVEVKRPIFGPSYTHFASRNSSDYRLIRTHTLAATSFRDNPQLYFACVKQLLRHEVFRLGEQKNKCPLVINSCGWINGLGARMLHDVLDLDVTDSVLIDVADQDLVHMVGSKCETCYMLPRPVARASVRTPAELRQMQTMAYFHSRPARTEEGHALTIISRPIAHWRPWIVSYDGTDPGIAAVISYGQSFNPDFLFEVLDGTLVGIVTSTQELSIDALGALAKATCTDDERSPLYVTRTSEGLPHVQNTHALDPNENEFHALALIRSIDADARTLHLVTPLSTSEVASLMDKTVLLVRGSFDSPDWAYLEDVHTGNRQPSVADTPWVTRQDMVGIEGAVWRLRHPPTMMQMSGKR